MGCLWENELDFYLKSSFCQCSHRTRSGWLELMSLSALCSHRGNGMRSHWSSALIPGSTSPILSPELEQEQGIPSEFCYTLGWCWGSLTSCLPVNVEGIEKTVSFQYDKYLIPVIHHLIMSFELSLVWLWKPVKFPDTAGAKILNEVPAPWYSTVQTKLPFVESAVTAFLKYFHRNWIAFLKEDNIPGWILRGILRRRNCFCFIRSL